MLLALPLLLSCAGPAELDDTAADTGPPTAVDLSPLALRFHLTDTGIDLDLLRAGIDWNLSQLGALPPADGAHLDLVQADGQVEITLYLAAAAFPDAAHAALTDAVAELRELPGPVDAGRFFMLTLHEPWRYYAITGACPTLADWTQARGAEEPDLYDVVVSLLSAGDRRVYLSPEGTPVADVGFAVHTSSQDLGEDWQAEEFETIDLLPNGQQRFAAYDHLGRIQPGSDPAVVPAGQPARCVWCHEGNLMFGTYDNPSTDEALTYESWEARILGWQEELEVWRADLPTSVVYGDRETHTQGELVVREFHLPTVPRAAAEWGLSLEAAEALVEDRSLTLAEDEEWPDRGEVLLRHQVDEVLAELDGWERPAVLREARLWEGDETPRGAEWEAWLDCGG